MSKYSIEGIPVIIRFKTSKSTEIKTTFNFSGIEGIPVIIRFKTAKHLLAL